MRKLGEQSPGTLKLPAPQPNAAPDWGRDDGTGTVTTADLADDAVSFPKMQNINTDRVIGRATAGAGDPEEIVLTAAGRNLIDDASAAAQRATLGLGTNAVTDEGTGLGVYETALTRNQTIANGQRADSYGPITIPNGVTVTITGTGYWKVWADDLLKI